MSIQNYFIHNIKVYQPVKTGTYPLEVTTWTLKSEFKGNKQRVTGNEVRTNINTEIRADFRLFCNVADVMDYKDRLLLDDNYIYEIAFIDDAIPKDHHAEILLKRMSKNTKTDMGI